MREGLAQGRQGYIVCPLVEESDSSDRKAAEQTHAELQAGPFRDFRVGLLHGRQDEERKAEVMDRFRKHELDLLVCTSVIEVGIDVPNATLMVIEHAERFGLSQLHQLRGRVSRGEVAGTCVLFAEPSGDEGRQRLRAFLRTTRRICTRRGGRAFARRRRVFRHPPTWIGRTPRRRSDPRCGFA